VKAALLLSAVLLSGCATLVRVPHQSAPDRAYSTASAYNRGYEAGEQATLYDIRHDERLSVSYYALGPCEIYKTWIPPKGNIPAARWWEALDKEREQKQACAARHDALREQVKAMLGVIRDYE